MRHRIYPADLQPSQLDVLLPARSAVVTKQILSANGTVQQVKASIPMGGNNRRFIRLKVQ